MVVIFVEGGSRGVNNRKFRHAFSAFLKNAGMKEGTYTVVPCGGRDDTYGDYRTAVAEGKAAWLVVDSESAVDESCKTKPDDVESWRPWHHLRPSKGGGWAKPKNAKDIHCHLMVQNMEYWLVADPEALEDHFEKRGFQKNALSKAANIENVDKVTLMRGLKKATRRTKKGVYDKGRDSYPILELIDPEKIAARSPWVDRLIQIARKQM